MNNKLTNSIIEYIFTNLGFFDDRVNSLFSSKFLIDSCIKYDDGDYEKTNEIYVCETTIHNAKITIAGIRFPIEEDSQDMAMVVSIEKCPTYACFISKEKSEMQDGIVAFSIKEDVWMAANMFIQSSFLSGMEQLRDVINPFDKCQNTKNIYQSLVSFIKYRNNITDEG